MNQNSVADALRALAAASTSKRSETSRLRAVLPEIENAFAAGISREGMLEILHGQGFNMTLKTFDTIIWRLRRENKESDRPTAVSVQTQNTPSPTASPQVLTPKEGQEDQVSDDDSDVNLTLTPRARREIRASQFIKPEDTNPLLRRLKKDQGQ